MYMYSNPFVGIEGMEQMEEILVAVLGVLLVIWLIASIYAIFVYILNAVGLYTIAKRRGIHYAWLAWIPVANSWIIGSISDHYQYIVKNKTTNRRKILLGLSIAAQVLSWVVLGISIFTLADVAQSILAGGMTTGTAFGSMALTYLVEFALWGVVIVHTVFLYVAYYDLFTSSNPNNATAFLVLGIVFSFLLPYFVFACRKKDGGFPVRQAPAEPQGVQYIPAAEAAPAPQAPTAVEYVPAPETAEAPAESVTQEPIAQESDFQPEE